ncbi:hypothetical protein GE09DRAFT_1103001 [Coniochaeta sp. 2T2.1]|nr:hypothetical protein GE09DRAFT_1103001 [Coniochaeta sp. 2T2.1]
MSSQPDVLVLIWLPSRVDSILLCSTCSISSCLKRRLTYGQTMPTNIVDHVGNEHGKRNRLARTSAGVCRQGHDEQRHISDCRP